MRQRTFRSPPARTNLYTGKQKRLSYATGKNVPDINARRRSQQPPVDKSVDNECRLLITIAAKGGADPLDLPVERSEFP